jgi:hypothetical protein
MCDETLVDEVVGLAGVIGGARLPQEEDAAMATGKATVTVEVKGLDQIQQQLGAAARTAAALAADPLAESARLRIEISGGVHLAVNRLHEIEHELGLASRQAADVQGTAALALRAVRTELVEAAQRVEHQRVHLAAADESRKTLRAQLSKAAREREMEVSTLKQEAAGWKAKALSERGKRQAAERKLTRAGVRKAK